MTNKPNTTEPTIPTDAEVGEQLVKDINELYDFFNTEHDVIIPEQASWVAAEVNYLPVRDGVIKSVSTLNVEESDHYIEKASATFDKLLDVDVTPKEKANIMLLIAAIFHAKLGLDEKLDKDNDANKAVINNTVEIALKGIDVIYENESEPSPSLARLLTRARTNGVPSYVFYDSLCAVSMEEIVDSAIKNPRQ